MATTDDIPQSGIPTNGQAFDGHDSMKPISSVGAKSPVRPEIPLRTDGEIGSPPPRIPVPSAFDAIPASGSPDTGVPSPQRFPRSSMSKTTIAATLKVLTLGLGFVLTNFLGVALDPRTGQYVLTPEAGWIVGAAVVLYSILSWLQGMLSQDATPTPATPAE
jgi:hypothetical protein